MSKDEALSVKQRSCAEDTLKLALEALEELKCALYEEIYVNGLMDTLDKPIAVIKEALAQPAVPQGHKQEPVGEVINERGEVDWISFVPSVGSKLYTTPPTQCSQRTAAEGEDSKAWVNATTWRGLTDEQIGEIGKSHEKFSKDGNEWFDRWTFARAIEAAHGITDKEQP